MKVLITQIDAKQGTAYESCLDWALWQLKRSQGVVTAIGLDGLLDGDKFLIGYQAYLITPDLPTPESGRLQGMNDTDIKTAQSFYVAGIGGLLYSALHAPEIFKSLDNSPQFTQPFNLEFQGLDETILKAAEDFCLQASTSD